MGEVVFCNHRANKLGKRKTSTPLSYFQACKVYNAGFGQVFVQITCFVRMTLFFSKSETMHEAYLLLFLHRYNVDRAILLT